MVFNQPNPENQTMSIRQAAYAAAQRAAQAYQNACTDTTVAPDTRDALYNAYADALVALGKA